MEAEEAGTKDRMTTEQPSTDRASIDGSSVAPFESQQQKKSRWAFLIATFCGIGYLKPGPGTWASIATVQLWLFTAWALGTRGGPHGASLLLAAGIAFSLIAGIPAAGRIERKALCGMVGASRADGVAAVCPVSHAAGMVQPVVRITSRR